VQIIQSLHLKPRRTIRFVAWMNEENGSRGARAYTVAHKDEFIRHAAAIESDDGAGRAMGLIAYITPGSAEKLEPLTHVLDQIGAGVVDVKVHGVGSDLGAMAAAGVPSFGPLLDMQNYFDYHHTPADTLDKVDPENMKRHVAVLATLVYFLAESPQTLERMPVKQ
jgi:Zn-dependent M28 family amino/carboxypeptidase